MLLVTSTHSFGTNVTGLFIFGYVGFMFLVDNGRRWLGSGSNIYFQVEYLAMGNELHQLCLS
jgi:hypothetical protein